MLKREKEFSKKITQQEIAAATSISQSTISDLVAGKSPNITIKKFIALCKYFEVSPSELLDIGVQYEEASVESNTLTLENHHAQTLEILRQMEGHINRMAENQQNILVPFRTKASVRMPRPTGEVVQIGRIRYGGTLRIGHTIPTGNSFHPYKSQSGMWAHFHPLVFSRLVNVSPEGSRKDLSYNWEALDECSHVFYIREDIFFHNGRSLSDKILVASNSRGYETADSSMTETAMIFLVKGIFRRFSSETSTDPSVS